MSLRITRAARPLTDRWRDLPIESRGSMQIGISFRPLQAEAMGLEPRAALTALLDHPYQLIRLAALWNRIEPAPGVFDPTHLDWQIEAAERAGKGVILALGAVKNFGYPEFFVPQHHLRSQLREGTLESEGSHPELLAAAIGFVAQVVERYRDHDSVIAWQVEHEAVDPLGMEHSWRLATAFVRREVAAVKQMDPKRPILLNGFLPMSMPVALQQGWRTRDQGDSLSLAETAAEIIGLDIYPCHALGSAAGWSVYLDAGERQWQKRARRLLESARASGRRLMITEGQAEPWEAVTTPPNPPGRTMLSCPPDRVIENYNRCMALARESSCALDAYLFWGAEYWLLRRQSGDESYLGAFERILLSE
ncbi:MAG TPA: beta-galactosidase [Candidatus Dormibacteraeota bacterium]|nr:beta-galactosidase [Candidatus Dormibacteraeota bacterium]